MTALPRLLLVGPLPPPSGGMANQTRQLARLLQAEGMPVELVQTNAPYRPAWIGNLRGVRAAFRLLPFLLRTYRAASRADVAHVMANSGWAWHLFAAPAIRIAQLRGVPVVVNYRGGLAAEFLAKQGARVRRGMSRAAALVVPTRFLQQVFARHDMPAQTIPNVVDVTIFRPAEPRLSTVTTAPHLVVTRNLEHLYGNDIALRALARVRQHIPGARLSIAGSGPERAALERLADELGLNDAVRFTGRLETADIVKLYQSADLVLNPSRADNTPNSVLEALACGVPVVSTNVGGVPFLVQHASTAWLVPPDDVEAMAEAALRVLGDAVLQRELVDNGLTLARGCAWPVVKDQWLGLYVHLASERQAARGAPSQVA